MNRTFLFRLLKVLLLAYGSFGLAFYYLQDRLLFRPEPVDRNYNYAFPMPYQEMNLMVNSQSNLNLVQFASTADTLRGVVLYFHGNRINVSWYARFAPYFTHEGYDVWMPDYPGYGKSTGVLTEKALYEWALITYKLARKRFPPEQIIIYGKSMGTGIAAQLASVRDCRQLILETPYYDFASILRPYMSLYPLGQMLKMKLPTHKYLKKVTAPVTLLHGTADWTVRYSNALQLQKDLGPHVNLVTAEGGSHNDLFQFPVITQSLKVILTQ